jgi:hypothetical protein
MKNKVILPFVSSALLLLSGCSDTTREAFMGEWKGTHAETNDHYDVSETLVLTVADATHSDMVTVSASVEGIAKVQPDNPNPLAKNDVSRNRSLKRPLYVNGNRLTRDDEGRLVIFEYDEDTDSLKGMSDWWEMGVYEGNAYTRVQ